MAILWRPKSEGAAEFLRFNQLVKKKLVCRLKTTVELIHRCFNACFYKWSKHYDNILVRVYFANILIFSIADSLLTKQLQFAHARDRSG